MNQRGPMGPSDAMMDGMTEGDLAALRRRAKLLNAFKARWKIACVTAVVPGIVGMVLGYFSISDRFLSAGFVEMRPVETTVLWDTREKGVPPMFRQLLQTQPLIITGSEVASAAMEDEEWLTATTTHGVAYTRSEFEEAISAEQTDPGGYMFRVSFEADHPEVAAAGVNAALRAYQLKGDREDETESRAGEVREENRQKHLADIERLREEIATEAGSLGVSGLRHQQQTKMARLDELDEIIDDLRRREETGAEALAEEADPELALLMAHLRSIQLELEAEFAAGRLENSRSVLRLQTQEASALARLAAYEAEHGVGAGASAEGSRADTERELRVKERNELGIALADVNDRLRKIDLLERDLDRSEDRLARVVSQIEMNDIESTVSGRINVTMYGFPRPAPSNSGKRLQLAIACGGMMGMLGLTLTVGTALLSRRVASSHDAELELPGMPMWASLPEVGSVPEAATVAGLRVHQLRSQLHIAGGGDGCQVIAVSSPGPGSGKTSLISALGMAFATSGSRTLIVDADLVGGALTTRFGVTPRPTAERLVRDAGLIDDEGLAMAINSASQSGMRVVDWLHEQGRLNAAQRDAIVRRQQEVSLGIMDVGAETPLSDCVGPAGLANLYILPQGADAMGHANTLSPALLKRIIEQARLEYDVVLFDTGPAGSSVEASLVASLAERTLLVVARGDHRGATVMARNKLESARARVEGFVFNRAAMSERGADLSSVRSVSRRADAAADQARLNPADVERYGPLAAAVLATSSARLAANSLDASASPKPAASAAR
ncbi:MAG: AAA family ATPase [Planctomycetota bacterium]